MYFVWESPLTPDEGVEEDEDNFHVREVSGAASQSSLPELSLRMIPEYLNLHKEIFYITLPPNLQEELIMLMLLLHLRLAELIEITKLISRMNSSQ